MVGAPQTLLGRYLLGRGKFRALGEFIAGGADEQARSYLDSILFDVLSSTDATPLVHVHVGERERHRAKHVEPLLAAFGAQGIDYRLDLGDYDSHEQVAEFFPPFLLDTIEEIVTPSRTGSNPAPSPPRDIRRASR